MFIALGASLLVTKTATPAASNGVLWREDFRGTLDWVDPTGHGRPELDRVYSVVKGDGSSLLRGRHDTSAPSCPGALHYGKAFQKAPIPLDRVRSLKWRWRVRVHPSVKDDAWQDMAASVYVIMKAPSLFSKGRGFKFGWLAKPGPADTRQRGIVQVPARHDPPSDRWQTEEVDLCALYRQSFGPCEGQQVLYVGVVTDADGTGSVAEGEYADFELTGEP
jgi:hypothetical protein